MKPGPSFQMGRAFALFTLAISLSGLALCGAAAQAFRSAPRAAAAPAPSFRPPKPFRGTDIATVTPPRISQEEFNQWMTTAQAIADGKIRASAATPPPTTPQFGDLTTVDETTNPPARPPRVGHSTRCKEQQPFWSFDQLHIYFVSNNVDTNIANYGISVAPPNAPAHIYRMTQDGAILQRITGLTANDATTTQFYPALSHSQAKLAYVEKASVQSPGQLVVIDLPSGSPLQLTGRNDVGDALNADLVNIEHPTWSPGDAKIVFSANEKSSPSPLRNLYIIDVVSKHVTRLTNTTANSGVECIEPAYYHVFQLPHRVVFAANSPSAAGGVLNTGAPTPFTDHNLFILSIDSADRPGVVQQITTATSDDREPAFNTSPPPNPGGTPGAFNNWLAFASKGRQGAVTFDIYFYDFPSGDVDANGPAETGARTPIRLFTPDTIAGAVPPTGDVSEERYPTWSSAQPQQNPIDRIVFSSNRQNNVNDLTRPLPPDPTDPNADTDLWFAEVTDITPPTLFTFNEETGETLHIANRPLPAAGQPDIGLRLGAPGDKFYFYAKIQDLQYGVESVWAQIKDPDGPSTDSQGTNRKLFGVGQFPGPGGPSNNVWVARFSTNGIFFIHHPLETDFSGVGATDYAYFSGPVRFDAAAGSRAQFASFNPGVDDAVRWSGNGSSFINGAPVSNRPPKDVNGNDRWLNMHDDGIFPDKVAGDNIYSAEWQTPNEPSDFYVDVIAYDKAFNPRNPSQQQNWIVYDNLWGFSTQSFLSHNPVLFVDDNGAGQKWPRGLKGAFRSFATFRYCTESDATDRRTDFWPKEYFVLSQNIRPIRDPSIFSPNPADGQMFDFLSGDAVPYDYIGWFNGRFGGGPQRAYRYDMWRVLAKGPVPDSVFNSYTPQIEQQPADGKGNSYIPRPIPKRAIVWSAPYTGDIFAGNGHIMNQAVQAKIAQFQNNHGRLVVGGGDLAWALTLDNPNAQPAFLRDTLGARYVGDTIGRANDNTNQNTWRTGPLATILHFDPRGIFQNSPIGASPPYWDPLYAADWLGALQGFGGTAANRLFTNEVGNSRFTVATDGTPFQVQDAVAPQANWEEILEDRMVARHDTTTDSKTVYASFSLASIGRRTIAAGDDPTMGTPPPVLDTMNMRAKLSHAMFCWMFSCDLTGQVATLDGATKAPIPGAWVQAYQGTTLVGSAFSNADGTYNIHGLPVGGWNIRVSTPGFASFQKDTGNSAHGLDKVFLDVLMTHAAPGSISGKVLDTFGQPIPGVRIKAVLQASPFYTGQRDFFAPDVTDANGKYTIPSLPVGDYDLSVSSVPTFSNGSPRFTDPVAKFSQPVTVNTAADSPDKNFEMTGKPGPLTVNVFEATPQGTRGAPVPDADVTLLDASRTPIPGFTKKTDASGVAAFTNVPPGPTVVSVFKPGKQEGVKTVNIPQQDTVEFLLVDAPTQTLYGRVVRALDNTPLGAADNIPLVLRTRASKTRIDGTTVFDQITITVNGTAVTHNYRFDNAQEGPFEVAFINDPNDPNPRFFDATVPVDIGSTPPNQAPVLQLLGRDGTLFGTAHEKNANGSQGAPVQQGIVQVAKASNPNQIVTTTTTRDDGTWTTGTPKLPSDNYIITIRKFGLKSGTKTVFVAGDTDAGDILLDREARGRVFGLVTSTLDNQPRDKVKILFRTQASSPFGVIDVATAESFLPVQNTGAGDFNYEIGGTAADSALLPAGTYDVVINDSRYRPVTTTVTVPSNGSVRKDFALNPLSGILSGKVREFDAANGNPPVPNARVIVTINGAIQATLQTDANGNYRTGTTIPAGVYHITASKIGFVDNSVDVLLEGPTTAPDIILTRVPPSAITGTVTSKLDNSPIQDADVQLFQSSGTGPVLVSTKTLANGTYRLFPVVTGNYLVRVSKRGWKPAEVLVSVNPNEDRTNVNFKLDPEHIFGRGLQMISLPDDYSGQDAATVLGLDPRTFKSAYWITEQSRYAIYPSAPAAEFKVGKALFVRFTSATAFTNSGAPAPAIMEIPVKTGWNMIGSGRRFRVDWLAVKVRTSRGDTMTMTQAMEQGLIFNALYKYVDGLSPASFLEPFLGYWMKANEDVTLIIPDSTTASRASSRDRARYAALRRPSPAAVSRELRGARLLSGGLRPNNARTPGRLEVSLPGRGAPTLINRPAEATARRRRLG